jgi:hypothetical protein
MFIRTLRNDSKIRSKRNFTTNEMPGYRATKPQKYSFALPVSPDGLPNILCINWQELDRHNSYDGMLAFVVSDVNDREFTILAVSHDLLARCTGYFKDPLGQEHISVVWGQSAKQLQYTIATILTGGEIEDISHDYDVDSYYRYSKIERSDVKRCLKMIHDMRKLTVDNHYVVVTELR